MVIVKFCLLLLPLIVPISSGSSSNTNSNSNSGTNGSGSSSIGGGSGSGNNLNSINGNSGNNGGNSGMSNNNKINLGGIGADTAQLSSRVVHTKYGAVSGVIVYLEGRHLDPVEAFKGIPYASPPVGSLRFMPPVTGALWSGVKKADR